MTVISGLPDLRRLGSLCDASIHIYENGRALAPTTTIVPPHAPLEAYQAMQREFGLSRVVVTQPTAYAFDNSLILETLKRIGADGRAVVVVPPDVTEEMLQSMHDLGVRSVRFVMYQGGVLGWDAAEPIARKIAPLKWTLKFQLPGDCLSDHAPILRSLPTGYIIDVNPTTFSQHIDATHSSFRTLRRLLADGQCWISFCAPYLPEDRVPMADRAFVNFARQLLADNPQRCVWASHWPYLGVNPSPKPEAGLEWLTRVTSAPRELAAILIDNPAKLFGF